MLAPSTMLGVWQVRRTRTSWELVAELKPTQNGEYHTCLMTRKTRARAVIQHSATLVYGITIEMAPTTIEWCKHKRQI